MCCALNERENKGIIDAICLVTTMARRRSVFELVRGGAWARLEEAPEEAFLATARRFDLTLLAVENGHYRTAWWLLAKARQLEDETLVKGWRPVHLLAAEDRVDALRDVDVGELRRTTSLEHAPVHVAAMCGSVQVLEFLVR